MSRKPTDSRVIIMEALLEDFRVRLLGIVWRIREALPKDKNAKGVRKILAACDEIEKKMKKDRAKYRAKGKA